MCVCARAVMPLMELKPNAGSDRAWVWNTHADFADEEPKPELLAIRFLNAESEYTHTRARARTCHGSIVRCSNRPSAVRTHWFVLVTDAQKFKVKFDECKEEVRKSLEGNTHTHTHARRLTLFGVASSGSELFQSATVTLQKCSTLSPPPVGGATERSATPVM